MKQNNSRRQIIIHSIWGNINIVIRYLSGFVATSLVAKHISPSAFGRYQLVLTFLMVFESLVPVTQSHIQNYIAKNTNNQQIASNIWVVQILLIWLIASFMCIGFYFLKNDFFWILLLIACLKLPFNVFDIVQIVADSKHKNFISQQIQITNHLSFNISRVIISLITPSILLLLLANIIQGIVTLVHQLLKWKEFKINIQIFEKANFRFLYTLTKENTSLVIVSILTLMQAKLFSIILSGILTPEEYGNYQLTLKLMEPASALGAIIFSANYTVLASTYINNKNIFITRFSKVSALSILLSLVSVVVIYIFPKDLLISILGKSYSSAIFNLNSSSIIIFSTTLLNIFVQYYTLTQKYINIVIVNISIILGFVIFSKVLQSHSLSTVLYAQAMIPLIFMFLISLFLLLKNIKSSNKKAGTS